jgi:hypothetical protein
MSFFLHVGRPSVGPDERKTDGANDLFPHETFPNKKISPGKLPEASPPGARIVNGA